MRIGVDATPAVDMRPMTGHGVRGIGRLTGALIEAMLTEEPVFSANHLRLLVASGQLVTQPEGMPPPWITRRPGPLPQHLAPLAALIADRWALWGGAPDLWHHTDPTRPLSPLRDDRTIVTVHDLAPMRMPVLLERMRPHRRLAYRRYLRLVRRARLVVAVSDSAAADVERLLGVPSQRIRVLTPWVRGRGAEDGAANGTGPARLGPIALLIVGVSDPNKRFDLAIRALSVLRKRGHDLTLSVAGVQAPQELTRLAMVASQEGVGSAVSILGYLQPNDLEALYARSVTLAVSSMESFPLPPVEAILSGGRVAAVDIPAYRATVSGLATFAHDDTPQGVATAVEGAMTTPTDAELVHALRAKFSARACAASLRNIYEAALGG
jgi:glycosyltransferase involved in cell wall biosynthesis